MSACAAENFDNACEKICPVGRVEIMHRSDNWRWAAYLTAFFAGPHGRGLLLPRLCSVGKAH